MTSRELPRLLAGAGRGGGAPTLEEHADRVGPLPGLGSAASGRWLLDEVERSGLRGRGGAGFPTSVKLAAVAEGRGRKVVVANGTEGEPASRKDAALLARAPHLVLDGALAAANAIGADEVIVVVSRGARGGLERAGDAVARRDGRTPGVRLSLCASPERFVMGEESALVHWLNGGPPATPTLTPPRPFERGVWSRPTLVQNVETLAHIGLIARYGADWFCRLGTDAEPGSMLVSVGGAVRRPGVDEVEVGTPLGEVLAASGGVTGPIGGILVGGYFGTWLACPGALDLPLSQAGLGVAGASPGAGVIMVLPAGSCGLRETARVVTYLAGESAGQCGPCRFGLGALARALAALARGRGVPAALRDLEGLPAEISGRGACAHPDGVVRLVRSALSVFADEVERHRAGYCSATDHAPLLPVPTGGRS